ncbi:MAG: tetratricopeptide repeat protein [Syntrophomonadaceae bacterium]|nr:tetratricopeptide repeat protein [Syntrophomonadaceae bacterium]MDD3022375.1 tetratricopeptide repeat protein [Syntrophomonadaceae bacterium]
MANKKNLGTGLDLLLSANGSSKLNKHEDAGINLARQLFEQAINEDEKGQLFEAYYLFRRVIDILESCLALNIPGSAPLYSQACNNLAIILHEGGEPATAIRYLEMALKICPDNSIAQENLAAIIE